MALTTPRGFSGGPMADIDYGVGAAGASWVEAPGALAVTQPNTGTRTVSIAGGNGCAYGVRVTNDAALAQALAAPSSGTAWYLLALRFDWSARSVTLQALPGPTSGDTNTPTAVPAALPATMQTTPGLRYDLPLAWVSVNSATTTATIFDIRTTRDLFGQPAALTASSLTVAALIQPPIVGAQVRCIADGIDRRWNGTGWTQFLAGIDGFLAQGTWTPSFGGANTALGANGTTDGTFMQLGKHISAKGRLLFGSSASLGNGVPIVGNWPGGNMDTVHSAGYGWFTGSGRVPLLLFPTSATAFEIRAVQSAASGSPTTLPLATGIGTPAQSSELRFVLDITLT